ncbi:ankyrin repeat domain-containing protein [Sansalvadorimonas verongulae]|nr:ankyrin repeat domain-containing protein [Sansalvadorimonas verongulae]
MNQNKYGNGFTAIDIAAACGYTETVIALLDRGAKISTGYDSSYATVNEAAKSGNIETVIALLNRGANITAARSGINALHCAAAYGETNMCRFLITLGLNVNSLDRDGRTPLHFAAEDHHTDTAMVLIENGANVSQKTLYGTSPIDLAKGNHRLLEEMRKHVSSCTVQ